MGKSSAQIRRMQKRASERGGNYVAPVKKEPTKEEEKKGIIAKTFIDTLATLEKNEDGLNAKDKRTAKRKAEAIALEEVNAIIEIECHDVEDDENNDSESKGKKISNIDEFLTWFNKNKGRLSPLINKNNSNKTSNNAISKEDQSRLSAYNKYQSMLSEIEGNQELNSKERRSGKRKADAIACEESNFESTQELLDWYESNPELREKLATAKKGQKNQEKQGDKKKSTNPYILFVGQIPYESTEDDIYKHFQKYIGKKEITKESMQIRIPREAEKQKDKNTSKSQRHNDQDEDRQDLGVEEVEDYDTEMQYDKKKPQRKSRGFAFAEFNDPELMYECLKLHHTDLNGRRINVIRSAGGGKEARKEKFEQRKKEQDEYISTIVDKIIQDYVAQGVLQEGELDGGAILLCKRRSAATVEAALAEYIEKRADKDLENPSSFFTRIICNVTEEGEAGTKSFNNKKKASNDNDTRQTKKRRFGAKDGNPNQSTKSKYGNSLSHSSILANNGVDMSISQNEGGQMNVMTKIFPAMSRGRGRGRGAYM
jgi:RNA recognition motif-containing protein